MPFLGSQPETGYKTVAKQDITGTGATVYTLDYKVTTAAEVEVFVNNVRQEPEVAYTVSGNQITFTTAVDSGDDCYVVFQGRAVTSNLIESQNIADGAITAGKIASGVIVNEITKSTTEPSNPVNGDFWYDTDNYAFKFYDGSAWQLVKSAFQATGGTTTESGGYKYHTFTSSGTFEVTKGNNDVEYLIVAGGGAGGGQYYGGGGGAGGLTSGNATVTTGTYSVVIGAGGSGVSSSIRGNNGINSSAFSVSAIGGGGGGTYDSPYQTGSDGGSGGGGTGTTSVGYSGGSGTSGQGNDGGTGYSAGSSNPVITAGGGGGGKSTVGGNANDGTYIGGPGGTGDNSFSAWATATSTGDSGYYAGGGGGGGYNTSTGKVAAIGGLGGGGRGSDGTSLSAVNGQGNTGGGGGGADTHGSSASLSGNGGSGIVIIRYPI